jgi:hypothetical protein
LIALAGDAQFVVAADELDAEGVADHSQMPIGRPKEGEFLVRLFEGNVEVHG